MKKFVRIICITSFLTVILALNASAFSNLQAIYTNKLVKDCNVNGTIAFFNRTYELGGVMWYDDATVTSTLGLQQYTDPIGVYSYAEIRNDYNGHLGSNINFNIDLIGFCETSASIDDIYSTYNHHNCEITKNGVKIFGAPATVGTR